jgi:hypothetical protein
MKKKNIFSRITIWSVLLYPTFVSCTQDEFFDESCMYSTNASRLGGARMEIMDEVTKAGESTSNPLKLSDFPIDDIYGIMTLSWPEGVNFSSIDSRIRVDADVKIIKEGKYALLSKRTSFPSSHDWIASSTCYARIVKTLDTGAKDTIEVTFSHSAKIEKTSVSLP